MLADVTSLLEQCGSDWQLFHERVGDVAVVPTGRWLLDVSRAAGYRIVLLTCRPLENEHITRNWLGRKGLHCDLLLMRHLTESQETFKELMLLELRRNFRIHMVVEDNPAMEEVCGRLGLPMLYMHSGHWSEAMQLLTRGAPDGN